MNSKTIGYTSRWSNVKVYDAPTSLDISNDELLVELSYIALNPIDIKKKSFAVIPRTRYAGKEFSGTVKKVGSNLSNEWKYGDRVCGFLNSPLASVTLGTLAAINVNEHAVMKSPPNLSDSEAASFPLTFSTALELLERASKHGNLLVLGGGSNVGSYVIQLAKFKYNFLNIFATCSTRSASFVHSLGVVPIDYKNENLSKKLIELGIKFDSILDTVGDYSALKVWPQILKKYDDGGVYATIVGDNSATSYSSGNLCSLLVSIPSMVPRIVFGKQQGINYQFVVKKETPWVEDASRFFSQNKHVIRIASVYDLYDCKKAWDHVANASGGGKVLLRMKT